MAGNIVKWWKHKILGGYKQFSVLQECTTDSEELIHPVRAPSSCSAPPDLLLVGTNERDNNVVQVKSSVVVHSNNTHHQNSQNHHHHNDHQQNSQNHHKSSVVVTSQKENKQHHQQQQQHSNRIKNSEVNCLEGKSSDKHDGKIHLEELTCDVSVESSKSSQPLQFSFTFYDLDGHHGKITKDDIVGIVYTIYESIGKSVVVPHCGSKTINVRLTVSPEGGGNGGNGGVSVGNNGVNGKSTKPNSKLKKSNITFNSHHHHQKLHQQQQQQQLPSHQSSNHKERRQHRYRPRKLIKSDDEDEDGESTSEKEITTKHSTSIATNKQQYQQNKSITATSNANTNGDGINNHSKYYNCQDIRPVTAAGIATNHEQQSIASSVTTATTTTTVIPQHTDEFRVSLSGQQHKYQQQQQQQQQESNITLNCKYPQTTENIYESMANLKCCSSTKESRKVEMDGCKECSQQQQNNSHQQEQDYAQQQQQHHQQQQQQNQHQQYLKQISARARLLKRARKHKYQEHNYEMRQRSLSVGNENCWKIRTENLNLNMNNNCDTNNRDDDVIDGHNRTIPTTSVCWNNALKRNDLIDIIRESMEKNRLCFQTNGKPQSNIINPTHHHHHHRQRSNTVISRMATTTTTTTTAAAAMAAIPATTSIDRENYSPPPQSSHHIPIYHQQMAINPAILAVAQQNNAHMKTNLCGYDSYLHATICSSVATSATSAAATATSTTANNNDVQNANTTITVPNSNQSSLPMTSSAINNALHQSSPKTHQSNPVNGSKPITKLLKNGYYSQQNSPQFQGYQRLNSTYHHHHGHNSTKLNTILLNSLNPPQHMSAEDKLNRTIDHVEKWLIERDQATNSLNELKKMKYNQSTGVDENIKSKKDVKNYDNFLYAKLTEKLQQQQQRQQQNSSSSRRNNNILPSAPMNKMSTTNNNDKENIRRIHYVYNNHHNQKSQKRSLSATNNIQQQQQQQLNNKNHHSNQANDVSSNKFVTLIPINVDDPSECENLIHPTSDEDNAIPSPVSPGGSDSKRCSTNNGSDNGDSCNNSNGNNSSSTVHRYVHEHIHHHYHHFEDERN